MTRKRPDRSESRKQNADASNQTWRAMSPKDQLAELDKRLGRGMGAAKQRARLQQALKG